MMRLASNGLVGIVENVYDPRTPMRFLSLAFAVLAVACTVEPAATQIGRDEPAARPAYVDAKPAQPDVVPYEPKLVGASRVGGWFDDPDTEKKYYGVFDIDRMVGGKALQASILRTDRGEDYILSYRPMPEHFDKLEKRVVVRGSEYSPSGQRLMAKHLKAESIRLAEGETPYPEPPTTLPAPPVVRTGKAMKSRKNRWVQVVGTLVDAKPDSGDWHRVTLRLDDGTDVTTTEAESLVDSIYRPRFGKRVTLLGEVHLEAGKLTLPIVAVCDGAVDGCGTTVPSVLR